MGKSNSVCFPVNQLHFLSDNSKSLVKFPVTLSQEPSYSGGLLLAIFETHLCVKLCVRLTFPLSASQPHGKTDAEPLSYHTKNKGMGAVKEIWKETSLLKVPSCLLRKSAMTCGGRKGCFCSVWGTMRTGGDSPRLFTRDCACAPVNFHPPMSASLYLKASPIPEWNPSGSTGNYPSPCSSPIHDGWKSVYQYPGSLGPWVE